MKPAASLRRPLVGGDEGFCRKETLFWGDTKASAYDMSFPVAVWEGDRAVKRRVCRSQNTDTQQTTHNTLARPSNWSSWHDFWGRLSLFLLVLSFPLCFSLLPCSFAALFEASFSCTKLLQVRTFDFKQTLQRFSESRQEQNNSTVGSSSCSAFPEVRCRSKKKKKKIP